MTTTTDPPTFRVKFYDGDRCRGVEYDQSPAQVADLITLWGDTPTIGGHIVIERNTTTTARVTE